MVMQNFAGKHVLQYHKFVENGNGVTDGGQTIGVTYIVMELASQSLFDILKKNGSISEQAAHYLFVNILKGIELVHEEGFSH